ncbi:MAG TPA: MFS transporter [Marmoricola sp.]|nr:MFS transporter [Marmoricola sp.]
MVVTTGPARRRALVVAICFAVLIFDGFDLIVYGAIVPSLLAYEPWHLTPATAGLVGSIALIGMVVGALSAGGIAAWLGRRRAIIVSMAWFSVAMAVTALMPTPELFGAVRFLAGVGLGVAIPTCIAVTADFAPTGRKNLSNAVMFSGYSVGGIIASLLAIWLLEPLGFRGMFALGALPLVLVVPLAIALLPESPADLLRWGRIDEAARVAARYGLTDTPEVAVAADGPAPSLHHGRFLAATIVFCCAGVFGQLLTYGMNTWLPQIMKLAGYSLTSSLAFLLAMNLGAIIGSVSTAPLADRFGVRPVTTCAFGSAMVALIVLSLTSPPPALLAVLVAIVGFGSIGSLTLLNGFIAQAYPARARAAALSVTFGVARIGGVVAALGGGGFLALGLSASWNFAVWILPALLGALAALVVPSVHDAVAPTTAPRPREGAASDSPV